MSAASSAQNRPSRRLTQLRHGSLPSKLNKAGIPDTRFMESEPEYLYTSPLLERGPIYHYRARQNIESKNRRRASSGDMSKIRQSTPNLHKPGYHRQLTENQVVAYVLQPDGTMAAVRWDDRSALRSNYSVLTALQDEQKANKVGKTTGRVQSVSNPSARLPPDVLKWLTDCESDTNNNMKPGLSISFNQKSRSRSVGPVTNRLVATSPHHYTLLTSPSQQNYVKSNNQKVGKTSGSPSRDACTPDSPNYYHTLTNPDGSHSPQHTTAKGRVASPSSTKEEIYVSIVPSHPHRSTSSFKDLKPTKVSTSGQQLFPDDFPSQHSSSNLKMKTNSSNDLIIYENQSDEWAPKPTHGRTLTAPDVQFQRRISSMRSSQTPNNHAVNCSPDGIKYAKDCATNLSSQPNDLKPEKVRSNSLLSAASAHPSLQNNQNADMLYNGQPTKVDPSHPLNQQPHLFHSPDTVAGQRPTHSRRHSAGTQSNEYSKRRERMFSVPMKEEFKSTDEISVWEYFKHYKQCPVTDF